MNALRIILILASLTYVAFAIHFAYEDYTANIRLWQRDIWAGVAFLTFAIGFALRLGVGNRLGPSDCNKNLQIAITGSLARQSVGAKLKEDH